MGQIDNFVLADYCSGFNPELIITEVIPTTTPTGIIPEFKILETRLAQLIAEICGLVYNQELFAGFMPVDRQEAFVTKVITMDSKEFAGELRGSLQLSGRSWRRDYPQEVLRKLISKLPLPVWLAVGSGSNKVVIAELYNAEGITFQERPERGKIYYITEGILNFTVTAC